MTVHSLRHLGLTTVGLLVAGLVLTGSSKAGPVFSWSWDAGHENGLSHDGGLINWVETEFDTNTNHLSFAANFGAGECPRDTDGFTLSLTSG